MVLPMVVAPEMLELDRDPLGGSDLLEIGWCWFWIAIEVVD